jgi:hypothetical protein
LPPRQCVIRNMESRSRLAGESASARPAHLERSNERSRSLRGSYLLPLAEADSASLIHSPATLSRASLSSVLIAFSANCRASSACFRYLTASLSDMYRNLKQVTSVFKLGHYRRNQANTRRVGAVLITTGGIRTPRRALAGNPSLAETFLALSIYPDTRARRLFCGCKTGRFT